MEVKISLVIVSVLVFFGAVYWYKIVDILKHFFLHQTHPVNLAIFRIVVFAWIFRKCGKGFIHFFADFPQELMFVPFGLNWIVPHLPIDSSITAVVAPVCQLFALLAMFGIKTRWTATITFVLALYLLSIPNLSGKISHGTHHLVWFALLLAASPSGDAISVDAWLARRKGVVYEPSIAYAVPIRVAWILIGYAYFSAGAAKWVISGFDWIFSDY